jgi:hypothetical protein
MGRKTRLAVLAAVVTGVLALPPGASANTSAAPTSLTFAGNQTVGTTSAPQTVTVQATCTFDLIFCVIPGHFQPGPVFTGPAPGDFAQTNNCGLGFDSPGSCQFSVTFKPTGTGVRTATLDVGSDSSLGGTQPANVSLTGSGVAAPVPPPSTTAPSTTPAPTGQRARAIKKCKKKFPKGPRRTTCIKKAKKQPV